MIVKIDTQEYIEVDSVKCLNTLQDMFNLIEMINEKDFLYSECLENNDVCDLGIFNLNVELFRDFKVREGFLILLQPFSFLTNYKNTFYFFIDLIKTRSIKKKVLKYNNMKYVKVNLDILKISNILNLRYN